MFEVGDEVKITFVHYKDFEMGKGVVIKTSASTAHVEVTEVFEGIKAMPRVGSKMIFLQTGEERGTRRYRFGKRLSKVSR